MRLEEDYPTQTPLATVKKDGALDAENKDTSGLIALRRIPTTTEAEEMEEAKGKDKGKGPLRKLEP